MNATRLLRRAGEPALLGDGELVRMYAGGDGEAFAELARRHGPAVTGACRGVLGAGPDAEDAAQATWLTLARKAGSLRDPDRVAGWLAGTARRVAGKLRRKRRPSSELDAATPAVAGDVAESADSMRVIYEELDRLPAGQRAALILCGLEGLPRAETAQRLGVTVGTLRGRLAAGRRRLSERLSERGVPVAAAAVALGAGVGHGATPAASKWWVITLAGLLAVGGWGLLASDAAPPTGAPTSPKRVDRFGDLLPPGAIARLGTTRLRHGSQLYSAAVFPGGKQFVTAAGDRVTVWDAATGRAVRSWSAGSTKRLPGFTGGASQRCLAVSPDGKRVVAGGGDGAVRIWAAVTGKRLHLMQGHGPRQRAAGAPQAVTDDAVLQVAFAAGGTQVVSLGADNAVIIWNVRTGREIRRFEVKTSGYGVALSADGSTLAALFGRLHIWDVATGRQRFQTETPGRPYAAAVSPDGKLVAVGPVTGADKKPATVVFNGRTGAEVSRVRDGELRLAPMTFSAGGRLACRSHFAEPRQGVWGARTGRVVGRHETGPGHGYSALAFLDEGLLLTSGPGHAVAVRDVKTGKPLAAPAGHTAAIVAIRFAGDGAIVTSTGRSPPGSAEAEARVWDWRRGVTLKTVREPGHILQHADATDLSPDGKMFLARMSEGELALRDTRTGRVLRALPVREPARGRDIGALGPGGRVALADHVAMRVFGPDSEDKPWRLDANGPANDLSFSPDGSLVAAATSEAVRPVRVWRTAGGAEVRFRHAGVPKRKTTHPPGWGAGTAVAFSPDGRAVAVARVLGGVDVYEVASGRLRRRIHTDKTMTALAFSPDGRRLAAGGAAGLVHVGRPPGVIMYMPPSAGPAVRVFDVAAGKEIKRLNGHHGGVTAVAFSPDGRHLASGGTDTTTLIWDVSALKPARGGDLSADELDHHWRTLGGGAQNAYRAIVALADAANAKPFLRRKLSEGPSVDPIAVLKQVRRLDSAAFADRRDATARLRAMGIAAGAALRDALKKSKSPEAQRRLRGLIKELGPARLRSARAREALEGGRR